MNEKIQCFRDWDGRLLVFPGDWGERGPLELDEGEWDFYPVNSNASDSYHQDAFRNHRLEPCEPPVDMPGMPALPEDRHAPPEPPPNVPDVVQQWARPGGEAWFATSPPGSY